MGDDRHLAGAGLVKDEPDRPLDLISRFGRTSEWLADIGAPPHHRRISLRTAVTGEIEPEHIESRRIQVVGPGSALQLEHDRRG
jgi:hypothetical protein